MKELKKLYEERARLVTQMKALNTKEDGEFSEEESRKFDEMNKDFDTLSARIRNLEKVEQFEKDEAEAEARNQAPSKEEAKTKEEAIFQRWLADGPNGISHEERNFMEARAQSQGTTTAGGYLVPTGFSYELEKTLADYNAVMQVATIYPTPDTQDIEWPTIDDTSNTGSLEGEGDALATTDLTFAQVVLYAYIISSDIVKTSRKLLLSTAFNFGAMVNDLLGERIGRKSNALLTTGTGSSQPQGIVTGAGSGATAASASAIVMNDLISLQYSVDSAYRRMPNCGWMFNDNTAAALRKLAIGAGDARGLWEPSFIQGQPDKLLGKPITINPDMADIGASAKSIIFGDFNKYVVRNVNGVFFQRLEELYAANGQVGFLGLKYLDGKVLNSAAIKALAHPAS